jgi:hypothetical protein
VETKKLKWVIAMQAVSPSESLKICKVGFGTGDSVETPDDERLTNAFIKDVVAIRVNNDNSITLDYQLLLGEANGKVLKEFGLFCNDGQTMIYRDRRDTIIKESDTEIIGSVTLNI